jgi:hypothetical protein
MPMAAILTRKLAIRMMMLDRTVRAARVGDKTMKAKIVRGHPARKWATVRRNAEAARLEAAYAAAVKATAAPRPGIRTIKENPNEKSSNDEWLDDHGKLNPAPAEQDQLYYLHFHNAG